MQFLDPDNTYDILFAQKIHNDVLGLLTQVLGSNSIFDYAFPIALIDRVVPNPISPWCDNWSGLMFEFLKKLSRTHILGDGLINGWDYGFSPLYAADLVSALPALNVIKLSYRVESVIVVIPANSEGVITWQERDHEGQSAPYCTNLKNKLVITRRRGRVFKGDGKEKKITLSCHNWLHNSVCVAGGIRLEGLTQNQSKFLLYDHMAEFLDYLWEVLGIPDNCQVLTGLTATFNGFGTNYGSAFIAYSNPLFSSVPSDFYFATLKRGEEQIGKDATVVRDNDGNFSVELNIAPWFIDQSQNITPVDINLSINPTDRGFTLKINGLRDAYLQPSIPSDFNPDNFAGLFLFSSNEADESITTIFPLEYRVIGLAIGDLNLFSAAQSAVIWAVNVRQKLEKWSPGFSRRNDYYVFRHVEIFNKIYSDSFPSNVSYSNFTFLSEGELSYSDFYPEDGIYVADIVFSVDINRTLR